MTRGGLRTVLATLGAVIGNRTYRGRLRLVTDYLRAGIAYARDGWQPGPLRAYRCAGFRVSSFHARSYFTTFKEIFIEESYFFEDLPERPFIVDCGANIGLATCFFKHLRPEAEILAVEPSPRTVELLQSNLRRNQIGGVRVVGVALADREGRGTLVEEYPSGVSNRLGDGGTVPVELTRLSRLLDQRPIDLLKIDVEGMDIAVLEDLESSLRLDLVARVVVEYGLNESAESRRLSPLLTILERNGFCYAVDARSGRPLHSFQSVTIRAWRHAK